MTRSGSRSERGPLVFLPVLGSPRRILVAALVVAVLIAVALFAVRIAHAAHRPATGGAAAPTLPGNGQVLVVRLDGPVSPVTAEAVGSALTRAEDSGYAALVVEIDTPGGLETSMRDIVKRFLSSRVPVITWVTPSGARAASAGVFIVMAADFAAMSPGTNIGAATPINLQGPMDSTLARKATNDAAAFARTLALQRHRNAAWAEKAVREAVAVDEVEAVKLGVVDTVAATLPELLALADGREWRRGDEHHRLATRGLPIERIEPGFRQRLFALVADPNVAYLLMLIGFYGILFELQNPGAILPGIIGAISLILALLALSVMPINVAGIALILLSMVFFVAEIKVASHGLLAAGGVLSLLLGSALLFRVGSGVGVAWPVILGATAATTVFFLAVVGAGLRAQRRHVVTGAPGMVGRHAVVVERLSPEGRVRLGDELWSAVGDTTVETGHEVVITAIEGLTVRVRPVGQEARP
ncbi:MAG TPA: nodulation protein NfeD [Dongiaceae bacterium]|nr:nodulation protein NfeD [Dongiaceae bacterium]